MGRILVLVLLLAAPACWTAEFEYVEFDKALTCDSENNRYVLLIETYLWLDVPDKVWVSYKENFSQVFRVKAEISEDHITWKHDDFFSAENAVPKGTKSTLQHQLDLQNLRITSTQLDTGKEYQILHCNLMTRDALIELAENQQRD